MLDPGLEEAITAQFATGARTRPSAEAGGSGRPWNAPSGFPGWCNSATRHTLDVRIWGSSPVPELVRGRPQGRRSSFRGAVSARPPRWLSGCGAAGARSAGSDLRQHSGTTSRRRSRGGLEVHPPGRRRVSAGGHSSIRPEGSPCMARSHSSTTRSTLVLAPGGARRRPPGSCSPSRGAGSPARLDRGRRLAHTLHGAPEERAANRKPVRPSAAARSRFVDGQPERVGQAARRSPSKARASTRTARPFSPAARRRSP